MSGYRYEIEPRPATLGGGWRLHLFGPDPETGVELAMGGGVFAPEDDTDEAKAELDAYDAALEEAQAWLESRPLPT